MGRGIVFGGLVGVVFSGLVLALVSQLTERRSLAPAVVVAPAADETPAGQDRAPETPEPSEAVLPPPVAPVAGPVAVAPGVADVPVAPSAPAADTEGSGAPVAAPVAPTPGQAAPEPVAPVAETGATAPTSPAAPEVAGAPVVPGAPTTDTEGSGAPVAAPVAPTPEQAAPGAPSVDLAGDAPPRVIPPVVPAPATDLPGDAPRLVGALVDEPAPVAPAGDSAPGEAVAPLAPVGPGPVVAGIGAALPAAPSEAGATPQTPVGQPGPATGAVPQPPAAFGADAAPGAPLPVDPTVLAVLSPDLVPPMVAEVMPAAPNQEAAAPDLALPPGPEAGEQATGLPLREADPEPPVPEVITGRLPRIGDPVDEPDAAPGNSATAPEAAAAADALTRNGVPFDNADGQPMVAVVLLDQGGDPIALPFAVSVAVDAADADAAQRAAAYRAAGVEVVLLTQIPAGALASDASVALQETFNRIPDAVAVLESQAAELQASREVTAQVLSELSDTGHGLLAFPRGLNTLMQLAEREGVTAGLVFREIDADGLDVRGIKRFLDQAAFRARQEDSVILFGRNSPETITALAEWALGNRAASVALVPVSAALKARR